MAFPMAGLGAVMQSVAPSAQQSATPEEAFNQKIQEVGKDTMIGNLVLSGMDTLLSAIMVFGAVQVIRRRSIGLRISTAICWIYIIFELIRLVYGIFIARQYASAMQSVPTEELKQNPAGQFFDLLFRKHGNDRHGLCDRSISISTGVLFFGLFVLPTSEECRVHVG